MSLSVPVYSDNNIYFQTLYVSVSVPGLFYNKYIFKMFPVFYSLKSISMFYLPLSVCLAA